MQLRIVDSLTTIEPAAWNALEPASVFLEHGFLSALEVSGSLARSGFESCHLTLWAGDRLRAALPCYRKRGEAFDHLPDWAAKVATKNDLPYGPTLFVGVPFVRAPGRKLLAAPDLERAAALGPLIAAAKESLATSPSPVIHYYFSTADELELLAPLGFHRRPSARHTWRNRGYAAFAGFVDDLRRHRRFAVRRERKLVAAAGVTLTTLRGADITERTMDELWAFYRTTVEKYGGAGDALTPEFFRHLRTRCLDRLEVVRVEREGTAIGGLLIAVGDRGLYPLYWGAHETVPGVVFELLYDAIEKAIARELAWIDLGGTMPYQVQRGFLPHGFDYSGSWIGDASLDEAFAVLVERERAWTPRDVAEKLEQSPYRPELAIGPDPAT